MKRIIVISPSNIGTIASCTANIISSLQKYSDAKVFSVVLYKEKNGIDIYENCMFIVDKTKCATNNLYIIKKIRILHSLKKEINPDISISTLLSVNTLNVLTAIGETTIGIFHAPLAQTRNVSFKNYILSKLSYKFIFSKLSKLYAVSETIRQDVVNFTGRNVELVYNIHNIELIREKSKEPLSSEEKLIFNKPSILYVGHLYDTKGVRRLIKAFRNVKTASNLVLVGGDVNGSIPDAYLDLAKEYNLSDRIFFLGYKTNPYKYMANCSLFVLPSYSEGLPGVLIESLSLNKKVITTNSSMGNWEILQCYKDYREKLNEPYENELGLIVSNDDTQDESVRQLAKSIDKVLTEDEHVQLPFDKYRFEGEHLVNNYM